MCRLVGWLCCFSLVLGLVSGCGGPPGLKREYADVKGKVAYKGELLKKGTVSFQPAAGPAVVADIQPDGTYQLKGVIGKNSVMVYNRVPDPGPGAASPEERKAAMAAAAAAAAENAKAVPQLYSTPASPLKWEVKAGTNTADFEIN
jgi:hypothetical protein